MFEGWKGVVLLCTCIVVLGALAAMKIDGAAIAAIAAVQGVVLYFVRSAKDPPLPPGAKFIPFVLIGSLAVDALNGCALFADKEVQAESAYKAQQLECVEKYAKREDIDRCRARVRREWGIAETKTTKDAGGDR